MNPSSPIPQETAVAGGDHSLPLGGTVVSVIMIFLNAQRFIEEAIESVRGQSFVRWELLLVDDGSIDASTLIARAYAEKEPHRIKYLEHPGHENRGMSASRNRGLGAAGGDYIALLDADDVWLPRKLEEQLAIMSQQPDAAMIYGRTEIWWSWTGKAEDINKDHTIDLGVRPDSLVQPPKLFLQLLANKAQTPTTCNVLIRRSVVAAIGGFQEAFRGMYEDQVFFSKLCLRFPVYVSGRVWARYRQHEDSCCAVADSSGMAVAARLQLLRWIEGYIASSQLPFSGLGEALAKELWPYDHPRLYLAQRRLEQIKRRMRRVLRRPPLMRLWRGALSVLRSAGK